MRLVIGNYVSNDLIKKVDRERKNTIRLENIIYPNDRFNSLEILFFYLYRQRKLQKKYKVFKSDYTDSNAIKYYKSLQNFAIEYIEFFGLEKESRAYYNIIQKFIKIRHVFEERLFKKEIKQKGIGEEQIRLLKDNYHGRTNKGKIGFLRSYIGLLWELDNNL